MNLIQEFKINKTDSIQVLIPNEEAKLNYYYPTKNLNLFDQVTITLKEEQRCLELAKELVDLTIGRLLLVLNRLNDNIITDDNIGKLALHYQMDLIAEKDNCFNISSFVLWNNEKSITLLYKHKNKIYLDISPLYPWLYKDDKKSEISISFNEFVNIYEPIALYTIHQETVEMWLAQSIIILDKIALLSGYKSYEDSNRTSKKFLKYQNDLYCKIYH